MGWMPFYPQFEQNTLELTKEATANGATDDAGIEKYVLDKLKSKDLKYSVSNPEAEENFPRVWYIWRGNAIMGSMKGHEYCLKHYLGTHSNAIGKDSDEHTKEVQWQDVAPVGKMDLIVDLNFRMDSSALYSDIVLPAASWYEKADLNSTDLHSFIHPLSAAIAPVWESKTDWEIFRELAKVTSKAAEQYFPEPQKDIIASPLAHDSAGEISQPTIKDWYHGECEAIPGKTMHTLTVVDRDYTRIYDKFITLGDRIRTTGLGAHGNQFQCEDAYDEMIESNHFPVERSNGKVYPSLKEDEWAANAVLHLSTLTNGKLNVRAYRNAEKKTGLALADLGRGTEDLRIDYADLQAQPRRYTTSPLWSGVMTAGRRTPRITVQRREAGSWRTLTGRQHFYLDHETVPGLRGAPPTYKPSRSRRPTATSSRPEGRGRADPQLPHAAREVAHPLHLSATTIACSPLEGLRAGLAERGGRRGARRSGTTTGARSTTTTGSTRARASVSAASQGRVHRVPRSRAHGRASQVAGAGRHAGVTTASPDSPQAELPRRRLRPVLVPLQLLGADRSQPRHARRRQANGQSGVLNALES